MKQFALTSPQDYLALVIRRKWWAVIPFLLGSILVTLVVWQLPDVYRSETLVLVEPREVPVDFVMELVSLDTQQRLDAVTQRILSRSNLLRIVSEFEDDLVELKNLDDEQRVESLHDKIGIHYETDPVQDARRPANSAFFFRVTYANRDPGVAQRVASRLASLFIEYDNRTREEQVFGTNEFLESELQKVARALEISSEQLAQLKRKYQHELPDQLQVNLRALDRLYLQVQTNTEALDRATGMRLELERQMSETEAVVREEIRGDGRATPNRPAPSPLLQEFRQKEARYNDLTNRYTKMHPDVRRLKAELDHLRATIPPTDLIELQMEKSNDPDWNFVYQPNPMYQKLKLQLAEVERELSIRAEERGWLQTEIQKYATRVQNTPTREQEMSAVVRRYQELNSQYENLRVKLVEGKLAESLESRQKGAQFAIVDPANYPLRPSDPDRPRMTIIGVLVSLLLGLGLAFGVDVLDQRLWTHSEVERLFQTQVLIEIPRIATEEDLLEQKKNRKLALAASVAGTAVALSAGLAVYTTPFLRELAGRYLALLVEQSTKVFNL